MTRIAAQVPALFEALSGMDIKQLMDGIQRAEKAAAFRQEQSERRAAAKVAR
jgi:ribosomal protein L12E/L44/L45/RPP1/RPP2